jgi:hypothetical protein
MMLARIRDYLQQRGPASLGDIARHLDAEPAAVRPMLEVWINKGRVSRLPLASCPGGCRQCDGADTELYAWGAPPAWLPTQTGCRQP